MPNFKTMSIEELEDYRTAVAKDMAEFKGNFRSAGKALAALRGKGPEAVALAKLQKAQAELDALAAAKEESNG